MASPEKRHIANTLKAEPDTATGGKSLPAVHVSRRREMATTGGDPAGDAPIQRKAFVGSSYSEPSLADRTDPKVNMLHLDPLVRRFDTTAEMKAYTAAGKLEGMGAMEDRTWIRSPKKMIVLGEDHGAPEAPKIIKATGVTRFRYEGFTENDEDRMEKNPALRNFLAAGADKKMEKVTGHKAGAAEPTHAAEHEIPKYARTLADVGVVAEKQAANEQVDKVVVTAGTPQPEGYSLAKTLVLGLHGALLHAQSYEGKILGHPVKTFYLDNKADVDTSVGKLNKAMSDGVFPNFSELTIMAKLNAMVTAYETAARDKVGLDSDEKVTDFKKKLKLNGEEKVTLTDKAKELDYLRDASMIATIKEAKGTGDKFFVIGDAHRQKLQKLIAAEGLEVMKDGDFINAQKELNTMASMTQPEREVRAAAANYAPTPTPRKKGDKFTVPVPAVAGYAWEMTGPVSTGNPGEYITNSRNNALKFIWTGGGGREILKSIDIDGLK